MAIAAGGAGPAGARSHMMADVTLRLPVSFADQFGAVQRPMVHPKSFTINSADSKLRVRRLRWLGWGTRHASAKGQFRWCPYQARCTGRWAPYNIAASNIDAPGPGGCLPHIRPFYATVRDKFPSVAWQTIAFNIC